jgi:quercetin dioxygenase-like cupin family protein
MTLLHARLWLALIAAASGQTAEHAIVINPDTAAWTREKGDPAGSGRVLIRAEPKTGGVDLLVRYPAGYVIPPHFHDSNERIFVAEGQISMRRDTGDQAIGSGGFAFLPALEVQRMSCTSKTRCTFYLSWDGKPDSHPVR